MFSWIVDRILNGGTNSKKRKIEEEPSGGREEKKHKPVPVREWVGKRYIDCHSKDGHFDFKTQGSPMFTRRLRVQIRVALGEEASDARRSMINTTELIWGDFDSSLGLADLIGRKFILEASEYPGVDHEPHDLDKHRLDFKVTGSSEGYLRLFYKDLNEEREYKRKGMSDFDAWYDRNYEDILSGRDTGFYVRKIGVWTQYYPPGFDVEERVIRSRGNCVMGYFDGEWEKFDENGELVRVACYQRGKKRSETDIFKSIRASVPLPTELCVMITDYFLGIHQFMTSPFHFIE